MLWCHIPLEKKTHRQSTPSGPTAATTTSLHVPLFVGGKDRASIPHADSPKSILRAVGALASLRKGQMIRRVARWACFIVHVVLSGGTEHNDTTDEKPPASCVSMQRTFLPVLGTTKYRPGSWQHFALRPSRHGPTGNY